MSESAVHIAIENRLDSELEVKTEGLTKFGHPEILLAIREPELLDEAKNYLNCVAKYIHRCKARIQSGQTLAYGYWLTTFRDTGNNVLETYEYNADATEYVRAASLTLRYWKDQQLMCKKYNSAFAPPLADQLTVVSKGVFDGLAVQGVRYHSPDTMSGWWITTDDYDGNVTSLQKEHTYHITARRPELAKYLALAPGFRFDFSNFEDVWFEEEVAQA